MKPFAWVFCDQASNNYPLDLVARFLSKYLAGCLWVGIFIAFAEGLSGGPAFLSSRFSLGRGSYSRGKVRELTGFRNISQKLQF